jgi:NAD(P)-dependent dehydrogenase (short-subunit alcohol dehydrogenase family)
LQKNNNPRGRLSGYNARHLFQFWRNTPVALFGPLMQNHLMSEFEGRGVLVTGATSGIGRAVAIAFGALGAHVGILGRDAGRAEACANAVREAGGRADILSVDLMDMSRTNAVLNDFGRRCAGRLVCAVNAAGIDIETSLFDATEAAYETVFGVNVRGLLACMQAEISSLRTAGGGAIVNVTSIAAKRETPLNSLYNASKAAASMLTRCAALEEGRHGIRINELAPGPVDTPMLEGYFEKARASGIETGPDAVAAVNPLRKIGTPEEIAAAAIFLCSKQAAYITGACLTADGGLSLGLRVG